MHRHQKEEAPLHKTTINVQTKHFTHSSQTINRCCLSSSIGAKKAEAFIRIDAQPCAFHGCVILISLREGPSRMSTQLKACTFRRLNSSRSGSPDFCPRCPPLNLFVSSDSSLEAEISESPDPSAKLKHTIWYMHDKKGEPGISRSNVSLASQSHSIPLFSDIAVNCQSIRLLHRLNCRPLQMSQAMLL